MDMEIACPERFREVGVRYNEQKPFSNALKL